MIVKPIDLIRLIDLTRLHADDDEESILNFCKKGETAYGPVAAVCVFPPFVKLVCGKMNNKAIRIATVVNFPEGNASLSKTIQEVKIALEEGANEIDMVFPYRAYLHGKTKEAIDYTSKIRELCTNQTKLKVIIETGELPSNESIQAICTDLIPLGIDFIKTSTGKTKQGATLEAAETILSIIKKQAASTAHSVGIKISGGVRTISEAEAYIQLARKIMGDHWVQAAVFRIGTSTLLDECLASVSLSGIIP